MLLEDDAGFCPHCKQGTAFKRVHTIHHATPQFSQHQNLEWADRVRTSLLIYECLHCRKSVVLVEHHLPAVSSDVLPEGKTWRRMVVPTQDPRTLHESVPEEVRSLYQEASKCENAGALRGAGVLYRATVEELVKGQGATGATLYAKIDSLKGKLTPELVEDLHEARMLGNDSIHAGITYSAEEVEDVAGLIEEAVLVLYVQPEQKRAMREARKQRRSPKP